MRAGLPLLIVLSALVATACDDTVPDPQESSTRATDAQDPAVQPVATVPVPDTTAAAVEAHLRAVAYQDNWELWPDLEPMYEGSEPHGLRLTTYANDIVQEVLASGQTLIPSGATVVKENYAPDSTLVAITVMYKQSGFDPAHNDWFFVKFGPDWEVEESPQGEPLSGRVPGCQACHGDQADADYLFSPRPEPSVITGR